MSIEDFMLPCPIKKAFGVECLGCGGQRAVVMVFKGQFSEAFHLFPAVYTVLLFLGVLILNMVDKKRSYGNVLMTLACINLIIMIISYFYKHQILNH